MQQDGGFHDHLPAPRQSNVMLTSCVWLVLAAAASAAGMRPPLGVHLHLSAGFVVRSQAVQLPLQANRTLLPDEVLCARLRLTPASDAPVMLPVCSSSPAEPFVVTMQWDGEVGAGVRFYDGDDGLRGGVAATDATDTAAVPWTGVPTATQCGRMSHPTAADVAQCWNLGLAARDGRGALLRSWQQLWSRVAVQVVVAVITAADVLVVAASEEVPILVPHTQTALRRGECRQAWCRAAAPPSAYVVAGTWLLSTQLAAESPTVFEQRAMHFRDDIRGAAEASRAAVVAAAAAATLDMMCGPPAAVDSVAVVGVVTNDDVLASELLGHVVTAPEFLAGVADPSRCTYHCLYRHGAGFGDGDVDVAEGSGSPHRPPQQSLRACLDMSMHAVAAADSVRSCEGVTGALPPSTRDTVCGDAAAWLRVLCDEWRAGCAGVATAALTDNARQVRLRRECGAASADDSHTPAASLLVHQPQHSGAFAWLRDVVDDGDKARDPSARVSASAASATPSLPPTSVLCREGYSDAAAERVNSRCAVSRSCVLQNVYYVGGEWYMLRDNWNVVDHLVVDAVVAPRGHITPPDLRAGRHRSDDSDGSAARQQWSRPHLCDLSTFGGPAFSLRHSDEPGLLAVIDSAAAQTRDRVDSAGYRDDVDASAASELLVVHTPQLLLSRSSPDVFGHVIVDELLPAAWMLADHGMHNATVDVVVLDGSVHTSFSSQLLRVISGGAPVRFASRDGVCPGRVACLFRRVVVGAGCRSFLFPAAPSTAALPRLAAVLQLAHRMWTLSLLAPDAASSHNSPAQSASESPGVTRVVIVSRRRSRRLLGTHVAARELAALPHVSCDVVELEQLPLPQQVRLLWDAHVVVAVDGSALELAALSTDQSLSASAVLTVVPRKGYSHLHFLKVVKAAVPRRQFFAIDLVECVVELNSSAATGMPVHTGAGPQSRSSLPVHPAHGLRASAVRRLSDPMFVSDSESGVRRAPPRDRAHSQHCDARLDGVEGDCSQRYDGDVTRTASSHGATLLSPPAERRRSMGAGEPPMLACDGSEGPVGLCRRCAALLFHATAHVVREVTRR